jgi:hypothetical protein
MPHSEGITQHKTHQTFFNYISRDTPILKEKKKKLVEHFAHPSVEVSSGHTRKILWLLYVNGISGFLVFSS